MPDNPIVILTRELEDNQALSRNLAEKNIKVVEYPCIQTIMSSIGLQEALGANDHEKFYAVAFTSRRAVTAVGDVQADLIRAAPRIACVGESTAEAVWTILGREPWLVAESPSGESLARNLVRQCPAGAVILHPRGSRTTGILKKILLKNGLRLIEVVVYKHISPVKRPLQVNRKGIVVLASPSAARCFLRFNPELKTRMTFLAIGPTTEAYLKKMQLSHVRRARKPDTRSLFEEVINITGDDARILSNTTHSELKGTR